MVLSGRYAARVSFDDTSLCGNDRYYDPHGQLAQQFSVPADAQALSISFWYSRVGQVSRPLRVTLGTETGLLGRVVELDQVDPGELRGWSLYRSALSADDVARVRGRKLSLYLSVSVWSSSGESPGVDTEPPGYYIDQVRVAAADEQTPEAPLPAALRSDGTLPLLYVSGTLGTARMNTDGSGAQTILTAATKGTIFPTWSANGSRIAMLQSTVNEPGSITVNPALITVVLVTDANGQNAREIYRTSGFSGQRPVVPDPVNPRSRRLTWRSNRSTGRPTIARWRFRSAPSSAMPTAPPTIRIPAPASLGWGAGQLHARPPGGRGQLRQQRSRAAAVHRRRQRQYRARIGQQIECASLRQSKRRHRIPRVSRPLALYARAAGLGGSCPLCAKLGNTSDWTQQLTGHSALAAASISRYTRDADQFGRWL